MKYIYFIFLLLFTNTIFANSFTVEVFETQFDDKKSTLNEQTKWVFFTSSKDGSEILKESFKELKIDQNWMQDKKIVYVADIHEMPSLISRFIALPRMRDYPYNIALDREGIITKNWQDKTEQVTLYKVDNLKILEVFKLNDTKEVNQFITKTLNKK